MRNVEQRNFDCPESGEKCTDPNCTAERCCAAARLSALESAPREGTYILEKYDLKSSR
jgi:hypothetical protein